MVSKHEQYLAARDKWVHEDGLINHRLTWLLASQTLLFTGYGVVAQLTKDGEQYLKPAKVLIAIQSLGFATAFLLLVSIGSACLPSLTSLTENK